MLINPRANWKPSLQPHFYWRLSAGLFRYAFHNRGNCHEITKEFSIATQLVRAVRSYKMLSERESIAEDAASMRKYWYEFPELFPHRNAG